MDEHALEQHRDGVDAGVQQALARLRANSPGWRIEYWPGQDIPWRAFRERNRRWRGGHPACEAVTADELGLLIGEAIALEAKPSEVEAHADAGTERCVR